MSRNVLVRYGTIAEVSRFDFGADLALERGKHVVVHTHRGIELGTLLEDIRPAVDRDNGHPASEESSNGHRRDDGEGHSNGSPDPVNGGSESALRIVRAASIEDEQAANRLKLDCEREFPVWHRRIDEWKVELELIDLEWTLDKSKLILYVLNDRGPECTKLALQAAAAGLGIVEVQPVGPDGPVVQSSAGGCGSGHCGSGGDSHGCCG